MTTFNLYIGYRFVAHHEYPNIQLPIMSETNALKGKLALITGCSGGIGQASARSLARLGCSIAVHHSSSSSKPKADALVKELTELVIMIGPNGNIEDIPVEMFENIWRLNTGTSFRLAQLCIPHMEEQRWGRVIFTSSVAAGTGGVIGPHYASSKSALHGLVHWLSLRYAKSGITANAIAPALIEDTAMMSNPTPEIRAKIPIGRLGKPDEIASIVALCATNGYMTNKVIAADGGWTSGGF
ncbi:unnamed protein product [Somion occarium]|uniref:3-oxoacyl-[acyl-carrier-protein] reductase n=1 Tax=Somion occarium TaxID=3059160 RepID=A0ABP1D5D3_9APHY